MWWLIRKLLNFSFFSTATDSSSVGFKKDEEIDPHLPPPLTPQQIVEDIQSIDYNSDDPLIIFTQLLRKTTDPDEEVYGRRGETNFFVSRNLALELERDINYEKGSWRDEEVQNYYEKFRHLEKACRKSGEVTKQLERKFNRIQSGSNELINRISSY